MKASLLAIALLGCASSPPAVRKESLPPGELFSLLPSGADMLGELDLSVLRAWPAGAKILSSAAPRFRELAAAFGFDLGTDVDQVLLWWSHGAERRDHVIFAKGRFDRARILQGAWAQGGHVDVYRGVEILSFRDRAAALLRPGVFVLGRADAVRSVIDVQVGVAQPLIGDEPVFRVRREGAESTPHTALRISAAFAQPEGERHVTALALRAEADGGLEIAGIVNQETADQAITNEQWARDGIEQARPHFALVGLTPLLDALIVASQGTRVSVSFRLGKTQCEDMADRLARALPMMMTGTTLSGAP
jgi:hypothetical protein